MNGSRKILRLYSFKLGSFGVFRFLRILSLYRYADVTVVKYGSVTVFRNIPFPEGTRFSPGKTRTIPSRHLVRR
jgi:hypothetical protein